MRNHERVGLEGFAVVDKLRDAVERSRPVPAGADAFAESSAEAAYLSAVDQAATLVEAREARLGSSSRGVPSVLWFVLIGGGLLTVGFAYVFDIAGLVTRMILALGLTVMTVLLLWCIFQMEFPFARQLRIDPEAFEFAMMRFVQISKGG
jgi:hypothetical protein